MKKLIIALIALSVIGSLALTSCGGKKEAIAAPAAAGQTLIGIAMPETHVERWVKDGNQLKTEAEK
ncbi:MAG: ABC transporter, partial [Spirochaetota bacterium]